MNTDHRPGEGFSKPLAFAYVVGAILAAMFLAGWTILTSNDVTFGWGPPEDPPSTTNACGMAHDQYGSCDESTGETRPENPKQYYDRLPFSGSLDHAERVASQVTSLLKPFKERGGTPTTAEVRDALTGVGEYAQVYDNAVHADGVGFGIWVGDGCVYGNVFEGDLNVEIGGPVNDGGCLAMNGH